jgi:hypothetical protein
MDQNGVEKAARRLDRARRAYDEMLRSERFEEFEPAWSDFLLAANAVLSLLEQAAKGNASAQGWSDKNKYRRRTDPLLSYLHQARNTDENGLARVAAHHAGSIAIGIKEDFSLDYLRIDEHGNVEFGVPKGAPIPKIEIKFPQPVLIPVKDARSGRTFQPPVEHNNEPFTPTPGNVAQAMLTYLDLVLAEARAT